MAPRIPTETFVFKDLKALCLINKEFKLYYDGINAPLFESSRNDDRVMNILSEFFDARGIEYIIHRGVILDESMWIVLILHTNMMITDEVGKPAFAINEVGDWQLTNDDKEAIMKALLPHEPQKGGWGISVAMAKKKAKIVSNMAPESLSRESDGSKERDRLITAIMNWEETKGNLTARQRYDAIVESVFMELLYTGKLPNVEKQILADLELEAKENGIKNLLQGERLFPNADANGWEFDFDVTLFARFIIIDFLTIEQLKMLLDGIVKKRGPTQNI